MSFKPSIHGPLLIVSGLMFAGCTPIDHSLGEALKYDMALQTIDPDPVYPEGGAQPGDHGEKAAAAVQRYRKDQVKQVEVQRTSTGPQ